MKIRILTLNCWSEGKDYQERWPILAQELARMAPDISGLQEVFYRHKAALLQKSLGFPLLIDGNKPNGGLALISRFKKLKSGFLKYKTRSPNENYSRHALWVRLKAAGKEWDMFNTHLSWRTPETEVRQHQVAELADWIEEKNAGKRPCVVTGDMNSVPHSEEMKFLAGKNWLYLSRDGKARVVKLHLPFTDTFAKIHSSANKTDKRPSKRFNTWSYRNHYTRRTSLPERRIDFIWFRPEAGALKSNYKIKSSEICFNEKHADEYYPSDHFGVLTEIDAG